MNIFLIIVLLVYCLWLILILFNWFKIKPVVSSRNKEYSYTIIVPFRNEMDNLPTLMQSLDNLDLTGIKVDFIFVDDHSEDNNAKTFTKFRKDHILLKLPKDLSGKKAALTYAVQHAKGDIILTTDADCTVHPQWVKLIDKYFQKANLQMVFGGVTFKCNSVIDKLQLIEFAPLIGSGAASWKMGFPIMCNGANLAYKRNAFLAVGGYDGNSQIASGDDEFLLSKINKKYPGQIEFVKVSEAVVFTSAAKSFSQFFNQRKRWSSKWANDKNWYKSALAILIFFTSAASILGLFQLIQAFDLALTMALALKIFLEGIFIASILQFLNASFNIFYYLLVQLVYPFYVIIFGVVTNFGKFNWKDRTY